LLSHAVIGNPVALISIGEAFVQVGMIYSGQLQEVASLQTARQQLAQFSN
jgi:hypothetical protein